MQVRLRSGLAPISLLSVGVLMAVSAGVLARSSAGKSDSGINLGIHKIQHIIVIMQENRSFDSYFGTFPGADGIPKGVCLPDPRHGGCVRPHPDHRDQNMDDPHGAQAYTHDVNGGKMNGFVAWAERQCQPGTPCRPDVMGYHTGSDIPNYWAYARNYVLDDHMFEPIRSWSGPAHLYEVSGWAARCTN